MTISIDTNIFVYLADGRDPKKQSIARDIVARAPSVGARVALQVVGEINSALCKRLRRTPWEAAQVARNVMTAFETFAYDERCVSQALAEAAAGRWSYWDAVLVFAAGQAGCTALLTEDMQHGGRLGAVEIVNPFGPNGLTDRARELL
ncbi:MAG TPA: PIN domain-containing protein [Caulobacterales bacterium]|jgi:predicted nucleic acid-binding protein|nr:PIN domain-containing protein [Caulobacterales bacterium]